MEAEIYRERDVLALLAVSKATLWRWRKSGSFPAPIQLGPNTVGWRREVIENWLSSRPIARGESATAA